MSNWLLFLACCFSRVSESYQPQPTVYHYHFFRLWKFQVQQQLLIEDGAPIKWENRKLLWRSLPNAQILYLHPLGTERCIYSRFSGGPISNWRRCGMYAYITFLTLPKVVRVCKINASSVFSVCTRCMFVLSILHQELTPQL